jgi:hypothetical protein
MKNLANTFFVFFLFGVTAYNPIAANDKSGDPGPANLRIRETLGQVNRFDPALGDFVSALPDFVVDRPTLFVTATESSIVFTGKAGIAGRLSENSRVVLAPAAGDTHEAHLRKGTIAVFLDPDRPKDSPGFAVRTSQGVTSATGTFFAVTEYKGQTYGKVKKGTVKRKTIPPGQPNFAAYLKKSSGKPKPPPDKSSKK